MPDPIDFSTLISLYRGLGWSPSRMVRHWFLQRLRKLEALVVLFQEQGVPVNVDPRELRLALLNERRSWKR